MKTTNIQQEVLLFTNTSFAHRELSTKNNKDANKSFCSVKEKLEEACWNGLLPDLLPEIASDSILVNHLYLWRINQGNCFLCIDLAHKPVKDDPEFSLNPALFLDTINVC